MHILFVALFLQHAKTGDKVPPLLPVRAFTSQIRTNDMMKLFSILALFAIVLYGATLAQAEDVGYNTSDTDTVVIGSEP